VVPSGTAALKSPVAAALYNFVTALYAGGVPKGSEVSAVYRISAWIYKRATGEGSGVAHPGLAGMVLYRGSIPLYRAGVALYINSVSPCRAEIAGRSATAHAYRAATAIYRDLDAGSRGVADGRKKMPPVRVLEAAVYRGVGSLYSGEIPGRCGGRRGGQEDAAIWPPGSAGVPPACKLRFSLQSGEQKQSWLVGRRDASAPRGGRPKRRRLAPFSPGGRGVGFPNTL